MSARRSAVSLSARVAAASVVAIVVAVALLGVAVSSLLGSQLTGSLDSSLRSRAVEVARLAASTPELLTEPGALEGRITGGALFVQVVDRRGRIVARSGGLGGRVLPDNACAARQPRRRASRRVLRRQARQMPRSARTPRRSARWAVARRRAARSSSRARRPTSTTRWSRRAASSSCARSSPPRSPRCWRRCWRAARSAPLRRLSAGARAIERSGDASERLPARAATDEVGELAATLNAMLASLERARAAEQRFVADASHELRTPLTALRGNAAYVARHGPDPAALADIESDAARLSALLDDLLALAREDAAAPATGEPVALEAIAHAAVAGDPNAKVVVEDGAAARCSASGSRSSARWPTSCATRARTGRRTARSR